MKIALDAMGGDNSPENEILGVIEALRKDVELEVVLVGIKDVLEKKLEDLHLGRLLKRVEIVHAKDVITMHDTPTQAYKEKKEASINIGLKMLKEERVEAFVSAGNTGAVLASSIFTLGRIKNVERPGIVAVFPTKKKPLVILDIGANVDCKPKHLVQFAQMGSVYCSHRLHTKNPEVRILNIGEEEQKGNELTTETYQQLKHNPTVNFKGNIEPKHILDGDTDVVVCDGFVGNVILKLAEGVVETIFSLIKDAIKKSFLATLGGIFMLPAFQGLKRRLEYDEFGGTILLGVKKVVIIAHGAASPKAIRNAVLEAKKVVTQKVVEDIENLLNEEKEPIVNVASNN